MTPASIIPIFPKAKKVTLTALLARGYFPREIPPTFSTKSYARYARKVGSGWPTKTWTRCVAHNLARPGGLRRPLKIPNPISFYPLAALIANNWEALREHTWKQRLSASRPYVMRKSNRAIVPRYRYGELPRLRALRRRAGRHLLFSDIGQFYPTIYTHTIPWALHTKAACKGALKGPKGKRKKFLGDDLDRALQVMNEGQTLGIPIGPDTSLVVAEVLLSAVDARLLNSKKKVIRSGFRYVDDYELTFDSLSAAEDALVELQSALAHFELNLNPKKTYISELPLPLDESWYHDLRLIGIREKESPAGQRNDVLSLFSRAYELAVENPEASILRYAVSRVQGLDVGSDVWRSFYNCVLGAAGSDPSTLPVALGTLYEVSSRGGHEVPLSPLAEVLDSIIVRHAPRAQGSEVAWALFGALAWSVRLSKEAAVAVSAMEDDIVALLALHADAAGVFDRGALDLTGWADLVAQPDALHGEHWLLTYEASQQGWLSTPEIAKNQPFSAMSRAGVSFYETSRAKPEFPDAGRAMPGGNIWPDYA